MNKRFNHNHIKLTKQQKEFCYNYVYVTDFEPLSALKMAGYEIHSESPESDTHKIKRELMRNPKVRAHIADLIHERDADTTLDKVFIIEKLKRVISETEKNYGPHIKALELLGKHLGMFNDKNTEDKGKTDPAKAAKDLFEIRKAKLEIFKKEEGEENGNGEGRISQTASQ